MAGSMPYDADRKVVFTKGKSLYKDCVIHPARVKRIMLTSDVGRMRSSVHVAVGRAMEHFAKEFLHECAQEAQACNSRTINAVHMKRAALRFQHFLFLEKVLGEVVDKKICQEDSFLQAKAEFKVMEEAMDGPLAELIAQEELEISQREGKATCHAVTMAPLSLTSLETGPEVIDLTGS